jgi:hypothetical protein
MDVDMTSEAAGAGPMRRFFLCGLLVLAGCEGVVGPRQRSCLPGNIDDPCLTPDEQKARMRDRLAVPLNSPAIGPRTYAEEATR